MTQREDILRIFPERMRPRWKKTAGFAQQLQEIRLRVGVNFSRRNPGMWYAGLTGLQSLHRRIWIS